MPHKRERATLYTHTHIRYNKHVKSLVFNPHDPEISLANSMERDVAAEFVNLKAKYTSGRPRRPHQCFLWGSGTNWVPTRDELSDLRFRGADVDCFGVTQFPIAYVLNVHFKAGEWGNRPWCGSVITCVLDGRSVYARVERFLRVDGDDQPGYASVSWFGEPVYLLDNPLVVQVTDNGEELLREYGCIISINRIDPSRVMVELPRPPLVHYYMMRDSGYDTRR